MVPEIKFLGVRLRTIAQATEIEERVLKALIYASGTKDVSIGRMSGHFGTPIIVFEAELKRAADIRRFIDAVARAGILTELAGQADARTDDDCNFHFRLDKQAAYLEELKLAKNRDVIDVRMKVGVYPASRGEAVRRLSEWLGQIA